MDDVTLSRSFGDTTPAEALKDLPRRKVDPSSSDDDQARMVGRTQPPRNYNTISQGEPSSHEHQPALETESSREHESEVQHDVTRPGWIGKRIWDSWIHWERDHLELVLENKQSVARDHLGTLFAYAI